MVKKVKDKYLIELIAGALLTPLAHKLATAERGYRAFGGEILTIPLLLILVLAADQIGEIAKEISEIFSEEEEEEWTEEKASSTGRC